MKVIITIVAVIVIAWVSTLTGAWIRRKIRISNAKEVQPQ